MNYDPRAIANEFVDLAMQNDESVTPMKLQKLVFYAYGWCLAIKGDPLFEEGIQAWKYGPVVPSVYHAFKMYGNDAITTRATDLSYDAEAGMIRINPVQLQSLPGKEDEVGFVRQLIKRVWEVYGKYTGIQLSNATHAVGTPWYTTVMQCGGQVPQSRCIDDTVIKDYFIEQAK